jgi:hypothetical protein
MPVSTVLAAAPLLFGVLVVTVALLGIRAVTQALGLRLPPRLRPVLGATVLGALVLFALLVIVRFKALA